MKRLINEILKPIAIFSLYFIIVALLSNMIVGYFDSNITVIYTIVLILTYPIYYYFIQK